MFYTPGCTALLLQHAQPLSVFGIRTRLLRWQLFNIKSTRGCARVYRLLSQQPQAPWLPLGYITDAAHPVQF
jgi:hypothetical protein